MKNEKTRIGYALALTKYLKGFNLLLIISILCNLIFKVLPLIIGLITSYMVSAALLGDRHSIKTLFYVVGILVIVDAIFSYLDILVSHDMAYRILTRLRDKAYDKIDEIAPAVTEGKQSGNLISIVLEDIELLEWFYAHTISQVIVAFIIPVSALIFMGTFSWILPVVIIPFILILISLPKFTGKIADDQGSCVRKITGSLSAEIIDGVQGLKDIISFCWQTEYFKRFFKTNKKYNEAMIAYTKRSANENRIINLIIEIAGLSGKIAIVALVIKGSLSALWLMPMFLLSSAIFSPIHEALAMSTNYGLIFGAAKRVFNLFQIEPKVVDDGTKTIEDILQSSNITVEFNNVVFAYPTEELKTQNKQILNGLSFFVKTGETVAIVGASGSGKTTTARLLQRFFDVDSGCIKINGIDIRKFSLKGLRDIVTVVPQDVYLFNVSVEENLRFARVDATREEIYEAARVAQADSFIQKLPSSYNTIIGERGLRLSGGEKQRLSIAQAFLKNSPVLVLDEASANLDSENERLINQAVNKLKKGKATMIIAHRISTIKNADRVIVIGKGRIEASGTYEELLKTSPYFGKLIGTEYET